jgi:hypothetical protein
MTGRNRRSTMAKLVAARARRNNELAYLAWKTDGKIDGAPLADGATREV